MTKIPTVKGRDGFEMPIVGFGTWQAGADELEPALEAALEAGYRHIDTAFVYLNETCVGQVLNRWIDSGKVTREELFVVTKLPATGMRPEHVQKFLDLSLQRLNLSYVDLYLVHCPFGVNYHTDDVIFPMKPDGTIDLDLTTDHKAIWRKLEEQVDAGKTKHIGVSNFSEDQVERILSMARIPPVNNQIQLHVYLQQPGLVKYLQDNDIVVTSYSTLGSAGFPKFLSNFGIQIDIPSVLSNVVVRKVASEVGRSPAQVVLRHMIQKNIVVIPKSTNPGRVQENFQLFDFQLSEDQMSRLDHLNKDFYLVDFRTMIPGVENHPEYPFKV